jgi:outer membrane protein TolC
MKTIIILLLILVNPWSSMLQAQKIVTLKECYERAASANALAHEKEAYSGIWKLKDENLSKGWLPTLDANANAAYNSDVVDFASTISTVPGLGAVLKPMPHDQYKVTIDINQVIYDGGAIKGAKAIEKADLSVNEQQTEVDLYKTRGQVNNCYFTIMLLARQKELLISYLELITKRIRSMQSALDNGVILKSDIDVLTSEKIRIEQQLSENEIKKASLISILSDLTGSEIDSKSEFSIPISSEELSYDLSRPELKIFDLRKEQLNAGIDLLQSKRMPRAFGFATLGYGNPPGMNFFNNEFNTYYIVGAGVKWNIYDWNRVKNEKQQIRIQQEIVENRKTDMTDNLKRSLKAKSAEIASLQSMIEKDSDLIAIRKRITITAESQYENGSITATDYLNELNTEKQAIINFEIHKINLALARVEFLNISGKEIE